MNGRLSKAAVGLALAGAVFLAVKGPGASACGMFFASALERRPSLSHEQVLLFHDPATGTEHFVRELTLKGGGDAFGFVVPTPTKPEVAKVEKSPFVALRGRFPFAIDPPAAVAGGGKGMIMPGGAGGGVQVLSVSKVGSFTAFVLKADDATALAKWLANNKFVKGAEAGAWLEHYVKMRFHYVALKYDPPPKTLADLGSKPPERSATETVRISFATPVPYYPYFEPARSPDAGPDRLLELWVVSPRPVWPVALEGNKWLRPMKAGMETSVGRDAFAGVLEPELVKLLPEGATLRVQTFQDQKGSREGFGDVLFASREKVEVTKELADAARPLLGILDRELEP